MTPLNAIPATRTPVIVTNADDARHGQAGVTLRAGEAAASVVVLFDADQAEVECPLADLSAL